MILRAFAIQRETAQRNALDSNGYVTAVWWKESRPAAYLDSPLCGVTTVHRAAYWKSSPTDRPSWMRFIASPISGATDSTVRLPTF